MSIEYIKGGHGQIIGSVNGDWIRDKSGRLIARMKTVKRGIVFLSGLLPALAGVAGSTNFSVLSAPIAPAATWLGSSGGNWTVRESYSNYMTFQFTPIPFDSSLGVLESVDWSMSLLATHSSSYDYYGPYGAGNGSVGESLSISSFRMTPFANRGLTLLDGGSQVAGASLSILPLSTGNVVGFNLSLISSGSSSVPPVLDFFTHEQPAYFEAIGTFSRSYQYARLLGGSGMPFYVGLSYTYNYALVPEPGTLALVVLGMCGFGGWRLRAIASATRVR